MFSVFPERNQACKGSYQRTCPTDIDPQQQRFIIARELREEYRRRNVADTLTGKHAKKQRVLLQEPRKQRTNSLYPAHIPCEHKEEYEGQK